MVDSDAEKGVLGSIIHDNEWISILRGMLTQSMFAGVGHSRIYQAMLELADEEQPVDEITLSTRLRRNKRLTECGGASYIGELPDFTPISANAEFYAQIVREMWRGREAALSAESMLAALKDSRDTSAVISEHKSRLEDITAESSDLDSKTLGEIVSVVAEQLEKQEEKPASTIKTHISRLDNILGFLGTDRPTVIAARTGVGKTVFAAQTAVRNAQRGVPTLLLNLEMEEEHIGERALSAASGIDGDTIQLRRTDDLTTVQWDSLAAGHGQISDWPLWICSPRRAPTIDQLEGVIARHVAQYGIQFVVIDHLKRIRMAGQGIYDKQTERMAGVCRLQTIFQVPFLVAAQIGRSGVKAGNKPPSLEDLKGSGDIEEDAGAVIILHDPTPEDDENAHTIVAHVPKNGRGRKGRTDITYSPWKYTMESAAPEHREGQQGDTTWDKRPTYGGD